MGNVTSYCSDLYLYLCCYECAACQDLREISLLRMAFVIQDSVFPIGQN
jgi:hypothetical protein